MPRLSENAFVPSGRETGTTKGCLRFSTCTRALACIFGLSLLVMILIVPSYCFNKYLGCSKETHYYNNRQIDNQQILRIIL